MDRGQDIARSRARRGRGFDIGERNGSAAIRSILKGSGDQLSKHVV